jgi:hypothetical protein
MQRPITESKKITIVSLKARSNGLLISAQFANFSLPIKGKPVLSQSVLAGALIEVSL